MSIIPVAPVFAQLQQDTVSSKWTPHLSVGTGVLGTSHGENRLFNSVAPSLIFRPNDRWALEGGFRVTTAVSVGSGSNSLFDTPARSLAPYKNQGGSTGLVSAHVSASYRANERLWLSAMVYHLGGNYAPLYGWGAGSEFDVSVTAFSAAATYRFANDSFLHLSFTCLHDTQGTLPMLMHDGWMLGGHGFYSPMLDYSVASPFHPMYMGGW